MARHWMWMLLFTFPCSAAAQKKPKPLPMPPVVSHNQAVTNYACVFTQSSQLSTVEYWNVIAFAEYGKEHKRYWSKSLGTFRGSESVTSHNSESAGSGAVIGMVSSQVDYGEASKKCVEWKQEVYVLLQESPQKP